MHELGIILKSVAIVAGTTVAAIYFDNPTLLWWYVLALFV